MPFEKELMWTFNNEELLEEFEYLSNNLSQPDNDDTSDIIMMNYNYSIVKDEILKRMANDL